MPAAPEGRLLAHGGVGRPWVARENHGSFLQLLRGSSQLLLDPRLASGFDDDIGPGRGSYL